jgi:hypothetical protein
MRVCVIENERASERARERERERERERMREVARARSKWGYKHGVASKREPACPTLLAIPPYTPRYRRRRLLTLLFIHTYI